MRVSVIIPFYQRERGLLASAVQSVFAQDRENIANLEVIIVDDGSPSSARLESFPPVPDNTQFRIIEQRNAGVGAARNAALDAVSPDSDCVALLDSDDTWEPGHLKMAVDCLAGGSDFYFDDSIDSADTTSFSFSAYMRARHPDSSRQSPKVYSISGREYFETTIMECISHTSQVVYNFKRFKDVRFDESQRLAGEDRLFFAVLAEKTQAVTYSTAVMGRRGRGISLYRETLSWDSPNALKRLIEQILMQAKLARLFRLTPAEKQINRHKKNETEDEFVFLVIRTIAKGRLKTAAAALVRIGIFQPLIWIRLPYILATLPTRSKSFRSPNTIVSDDAR